MFFSRYSCVLAQRARSQRRRSSVNSIESDIAEAEPTPDSNQGTTNTVPEDTSSPPIPILKDGIDDVVESDPDPDADTDTGRLNQTRTERGCC